MKRPTIAPSVALFVGLLLFYFGERVADGLARWVTSGLAVAVFVLGCFGLGVWRWRTATGERRIAVRRLLVNYGLCAAALCCYVIQSDDLGIVTDAALRNLLQVASPALLLAGILPIIAIEVSLLSAGDSPQVEGWRIALAARGARIIFLALVAFAGVNFAAAKWNRTIDVSYFRTTAVGTSNQALVATLTQPVRILLFFPAGNEVLERVRAYVDELAAGSDQMTVEVVDQALDADLARDFKVRRNGTIALGSGERKETLRLGLDIASAAATLRKLDGEIQQRLFKVLRPARIAYLTTGHLERDFAPPADDKRRGLADFKKVLQTLNYTTRRLGLGEGLSSEVPDDATVVIVVGPLEPFLPGERQAIHRYLERGGRMLFFMDPDNAAPDNELLAPLGIAVSDRLVATDNLRHLWRIEGQRESPYNITTNSVSSHPSVTTLSRAAGQLPTLFAGAGQVRKTERPPAAMSATFTLRSMGGAFIDENGNGKLDKDKEKRTTVDLVAAVAKNVTRGPTAAGNQPMRAVVFGDADFVADLIVRNQGNYVALMDALRWLGGDEDTAGTVESEKDVRIRHRRDEDRIWFYGSSILIPASVLLVGVVYTRRTRRSNGGKAS